MDNEMKILIAGFSGAGKSTLIKSLTQLKNPNLTQVDDLDDLILMSSPKKYHSLAELIEAEGWEKFRLRERQTLDAWLKEEGKGILALGGGTLSEVVYGLYHNHKKIKFCYLKVPFDVAWERMNLETLAKRPLALLGKEKLHEIYQQRTELFERIPWVLDGEDPTEENRIKILKSMSLHPFST